MVEASSSQKERDQVSTHNFAMPLNQRLSPLSDVNGILLNPLFSAIAALLPAAPRVLRKMTCLLSLLLKAGFPVQGKSSCEKKERKCFQEGGECAQIVKQLI